MRYIVLALSIFFTTAICFAQEKGGMATATGSSALEEAKAMVDKEVAAMKKVAPADKKSGFNKQMTDDLAATLGKNQEAQKKEREGLAAKLSKEDKAKLEAYIKAQAAEIRRESADYAQTKATFLANDPGKVRSWCDYYHGSPHTDDLCTAFVKWCWDVCILPNNTKQYYQGPYVCGGCIVF